jgi:hypothetical protein
LAASLQLGLPRTSTKSTTTTSISTDGKTKTKENLDKEEPGTLPNKPSMPEGASDTNELAGISKDERKVGKDPMLVYTAATALYQEVKLLNRYVTDAALKWNYVPYIVRVQLSVIPYARNQPYDVYTTLGFFPDPYSLKGKKERRYPSAYVVPLLVTDNLEGALTSRSVDTIRQLALALSFLQSGVTGEAGIASRYEQLESVLGTDVNSLLTVARVTNNSILIRLGAAKQSTAGYAMLPRTHNITMVLMVPRDMVEQEKKGQIIRVVANTVMREAETGQPLPQLERKARLAKVEQVLQRYYSSGVIPDVNYEFCREKEIQLEQCAQIGKREAIDDLLASIFQNDYERYRETLLETGWNRSFTRDQWMEIIETLSESELSSARFEIPPVMKPVLPDTTQTALLIDNVKSKMRVSLMGGRNLIPNRINAMLILVLIDGTKIPLAAENVKVDQSNNLSLVFPSAAAWGIKPLNLVNNRIVGGRLNLTLTDDNVWNSKSETLTAVVKTVFYKLVDE